MTLDWEEIERCVKPLEWARKRLLELDADVRQDLRAAYSAEFLEISAILFDECPSEFRGLVGKLKARGVHAADFERKAKERLRELKEARKAREKASATSAKAERNLSVAHWEPRKPAAQPVNGANLLTEIERAILKYVFIDKLDALVVALWILFTHVFEGAETNPFLRIISPTWNCGKTTLLKIVFRLSRSGWLVARATQAAYYRKLQVSKHTVLLDEGDAFLAENEIWRNVLDGASDPDTANISIAIPVGDAWKEGTIDIFAPIAIASIGKLRRMHTVESRSVPVRMKRATKEERKSLTKARQRALKAELAPIAERCARWGADNLDAFTKARPVMPEHMDGREADKLEALFAVAQLCSPDQLNRIASFVATQTDEGSDEYSAMILPHIRQVFEDTGADRLLQKTLCAKLAEMEGQPWGEYGKNRKAITSFQLTTLLKPYALVSHTIRVPHPQPLPAETRGLGYYLKDFEEVFSRYIPKNDISSRDNETTQRGLGESNDFDPVTKSSCHGDENGSNPKGENGSHVVTRLNSGLEGGDELNIFREGEVDGLVMADGADDSELKL